MRDAKPREWTERELDELVDQGPVEEEEPDLDYEPTQEDYELTRPRGTFVPIDTSMEKHEIEGEQCLVVVDVPAGETLLSIEQKEETKEVKDIHVLDPTGFTVTLSIQTWEKHIIAGHPELKELLNIVTDTLREPEIVWRPSPSPARRLESASQSGICFYYRLAGKRILRRDDLFMVVVVKRDDESKTGFVKTAYLTKEIKKEGDLVWFKRV